MTFAAIPSGHDVFLDANTFVYFFSQHPAWGAACEQLLERVARQEIRGFTSTYVLSEMAHRLMTIEAMDAFGWPVATGLTQLASNDADFDRVPGLTRYSPI
ncbi:MAG TPA: hypothetical protein VML55_19235 [Planctomycetaceae bacterium]|nr:hypothetical protein [Planctomycetaceae bacterium]